MRDSRKPRIISSHENYKGEQEHLVEHEGELYDVTTIADSKGRQTVRDVQKHTEPDPHAGIGELFTLPLLALMIFALPVIRSSLFVLPTLPDMITALADGHGSWFLFGFWVVGSAAAVVLSRPRSQSMMGICALWSLLYAFVPAIVKGYVWLSFGSVSNFLDSLGRMAEITAMPALITFLFCIAGCMLTFRWATVIRAFSILGMVLSVLVMLNSAFLFFGSGMPTSSTALNHAAGYMWSTLNLDTRWIEPSTAAFVQRLASALSHLWISGGIACGVGFIFLMINAGCIKN